MPDARADRVLVATSAAIALAAVAMRLHDVWAWPAIRDWDASGHAVNVIDLLEGHFPNPRSWCGSHPPLYYALGAFLWHLLPDGVPVHVLLRSLSATAWVATVALVWRSLKRFASATDAAVVAALMLAVPGTTIASCMMTNDALCALFMTATLVRLLDGAGRTVPRQAAITGVLAGLAALTKATGVAAVGMGALVYGWDNRRAPGRAARLLAAFGSASVAIVAPHYIRLFLTLSGSAYDILAARAGSQEKEALARIVEAVAATHSSVWSYVSLQHTAMWGDPTAVFVPPGSHPGVVVLWIGGWLVLGVAVLGAIRLARTAAIAPRAGIALAFGALFAGALLPHVVANPHIVLTKTNYLMAEVLPVGILLAVGLGMARGGIGTLLRGALLAVAAAGVAFTWYGWWDPTAAVSRMPVVPSDSSDPAVGIVARYFEERAGDPIRAAERLTPEAHLDHGLRLATMVGLPLAPAAELAPDEARSLELARARVAWLELYNLVRWIQPISAALDVTLLDVQSREDSTDVRVRVSASGTTAPPEAIGLWPFPPFEQRLTVQRRGTVWRIAAVEQSGVVPENSVPAFVAHPTLVGFDRLRELGWHPSWEGAVAAARARAASTSDP